ncbi:MAG: single-stranded-DNA-specific exonuclease RecJ [Alicyclobacillus herbarius]|uniref:single-stranded-DNA-specific exonuclease RecJ n=1 Tax=Alicyclobacillus herbarius TaxID=122960 RepID=UPI002353C0A0|nr:single-stranded-DNA-specific exonuclease RecJ [Alicyclobacillus herbarius]MCL6632827.1 single-stranded-DNA-specific exonuclease RecJ [Alicyclobacillus herbarius]
MTTPLWRTAAVSPERARNLAQQLAIPVRVARWLCARGVDEQPDPGAWLAPERIPYSNPFDFDDMGRAVERIRRAVSAGERIAIVGDYDVDGVTASAILMDGLEQLRAQAVCLLPHRERDGYGLSETLVERALAAGCRLIVTVDNGIRATAAIAYALKKGIDVVITDHHEPGEESLPDGLPVVHWSRASCPDLKRLSGAGVAWKVCQALFAATGAAGLDDSRERDEGEAYRLGLAALGALADVMPMLGENRRLVRDGLTALRVCRRPGWLALCERAGLNPNRVRADDVLWRIAPRLNAAGRMDTADHALQLLLAKDVATAMALAETIEHLNETRKTETEQGFLLAKRQAEEQIQAGAGLLVTHGPWSIGIAGIIAAKVCEAYGRPCLALSDQGDDLLRGSGRAPDGFPLHTALAENAGLFDHFGGHDAAVGCGVRRENLSAIQQQLSAFARSWQAEAGADSAEEAARPAADDFLALSDVTLELCEWIERLGPYGPEYPVWRFFIGPARIEQIRPLGGGRHVRLRVVEAGCRQDLIWFNVPAAVSEWRPGDTLTAIVELEESVWQGRRRVQLRIVQAGISNRILTREHFAEVYRLLRARRRLRQAEAGQDTPVYRSDEMETMLNTFVELGFARLSNHAYHVVESAPSRDLREAVNYQRYLRVVTQWTV